MHLALTFTAFWFLAVVHRIEEGCREAPSRPHYSVFSIICSAAFAVSILLERLGGGAWVLAPLAFTGMQLSHGLYHLGRMAFRRAWVPGSASSLLAWPLAALAWERGVFEGIPAGRLILGAGLGTSATLGVVFFLWRQGRQADEPVSDYKII